ncbi:hypothetical protein FG386_001091 [Cryptosporidium ryanae]|uniref:uncharacterized protein n=1 Tax=Cryptosporidium ryanae TaxID=515981 RepID=UPI003519E7C4|nr:hypothetical protein FG386_001091 [Cryptosporidium ryanae]
MYVENQKRNGIVELELVHNIPKTERFDADINSPVSYDDLFESISLNKWQTSKFDTKLDIPNDIKTHLFDLLRLFDVDELSDTNNDKPEKLDNKNEYKTSKHRKSNLNIFKIIPPFLSRLMKYNLFENFFPDYFEFGSNLTLPSSFLVNRYRLLKPMSPCENPWYKGCKKLILIGLPPFLSINEIKNMIIKLSDEKKHKSLLYKDKKQNNIDENEIKENENSKNYTIDISVNDEIGNNTNYTDDNIEEDNNENLNQYPKQDNISEFGILRYTNMFTTENKDHYINNLYRSPDSITKNRINMALLEFNSEQEALNFWASLCTGSFECYGYVFTSIPDPSGLRIIAEGMFTVFSPKYIPLIDSIKSVEEKILNTDYSDSEKKELKLIFPLIGSYNSFKSLENYIMKITSENRENENIKINIIYDENNDILTVVSNDIKIVELLNNRIFQHCSFKVPNDFNSNITSTQEDTNIVNVAMFLFDDKICEPVIIKGNYNIHPIKHKTIELENEENNKDDIKNTFTSFLGTQEKEPEPVGFLFKKFEELREALKHDLDSEQSKVNTENNLDNEIDKFNAYGKIDNTTNKQYPSQSFDDNKNESSSVYNKRISSELNKTEEVNDNLKKHNKSIKKNVDKNMSLEISVEKNNEFDDIYENIEIKNKINCNEEKNNIDIIENEEMKNIDMYEKLNLNEKSEKQKEKEDIKFNNKMITDFNTENFKNSEISDIDMGEIKEQNETKIKDNNVVESNVLEKKDAVENNEIKEEKSNFLKEAEEVENNGINLEINTVEINQEGIEDRDNVILNDEYIEKEATPTETTRGRRGKKRRARGSALTEDKETISTRGTNGRGRPRSGRGGSRAARFNKRRK